MVKTSYSIFRTRKANNLLPAFEVDGHGKVDGAVGDLALVADLDDDGVEIDDGIDRV
jgi:hypothetical protein